MSTFSATLMYHITFYIVFLTTSNTNFVFESCLFLITLENIFHGWA
jgi:hypothetical protein